MQTKLIDDTHRRAYLVSLDGALEDRSCPSSRTGQKYRPTGAYLVVTRSYGGSWKKVDLTISGWTLKKNGTPGQRGVEEKAYGRDIPEALAAVVAAVLANLNDGAEPVA